MKKILSFFIGCILCFVLCGNVFSQNSINWIESYDEALTKAEITNKKMFILITAPSWCNWCVKLEKETFTNENVIKMINKNFIPVRILDKIDGEENQDLAYFEISGFPTILFAYPNGELMFKAGGYIDAGQMIAFCEKAINYEDFYNNIEKNFERAKKDSEYAIKFLDELAERNELELCRAYAMSLYEIYTDEEYKARFLFTAYICTLYLGNLEDGLIISEKYILEFPMGEHLEDVRYLRIITLYYLGLKSDAKEEAKEFKEDYPESPYMEDIDYILNE